MTYLDLRDLADEWQALLDDEDLDTLTREEETAKYHDLCSELGVSPAEPDTLRSWDETTLIPDSEFEDYARELAEDIGAIDREAAWPLTYIDWSAAAHALRMDYTCVTYDDADYLIRS